MVWQGWPGKSWVVCPDLRTEGQKFKKLVFFSNLRRFSITPFLVCFLHNATEKGQFKSNWLFFPPRDCTSTTKLVYILSRIANRSDYNSVKEKCKIWKPDTRHFFSDFWKKYNVSLHLLLFYVWCTEPGIHERGNRQKFICGSVIVLTVEVLNCGAFNVFCEFSVHPFSVPLRPEVLNLL